MKKRIFFCLLAALLLTAAVLCLLYCRAEVFNGSRVCNPDSYSLSFERMNRTDSHTLSMKAQEALAVEFAIDSGRVDLVIARQGGETVYTGNGIRSGAFDVIVPESGDYTITVTAKNAAGYIQVNAKGTDQTHE